MRERAKLSMRSKKWALRWLNIGIILILISCVGVSVLQTNFYKTQVYTFKVPTSGGKYLSCNMYRPKTASAENKVPLVIATAGTYASKEQVDIPGIELSGWGIAVIIFDPYMHGLSGGGTELYDQFAWTDAGMIALVEFAAASLDFVDIGRIGVAGHSLGGRTTSNTLAHYDVAYEKALAQAQEPDSEGGTEIMEKEQAYARSQNKVMAVFTSGVQTSEISFGVKDDTFAIHGIKGAPEDRKMPQRAYASVTVYNGFNDRFGRGNYQVDGVAYDLSMRPDMILLMSSVPVPEDKVDTVEIDHSYGNAGDHMLRVAYNPPEVHTYERFSITEAREIPDFSTKAFEVENPVTPENQLWLLKECFNSLGFIGMLLLLVPLASLFMRLPLFVELATSVPEKLPALKSGRSKLIFWGTWLFSAVASRQFFPPAIGISTASFQMQSKRGTLTWLFPQKMTNLAWVWAIFNAIVGLVLFWLSYRFNGSKNGVTPKTWGIKTSGRELLRSLPPAFTVCACSFSVVFLASYFFVADFRIWVFAIRVFKPIHIIYAVTYAVMFFPYYFMVSVLTNSSRRVEGQKEWVNLLICGTSNILGLALMQFVMYSNVYTMGINPYGTACLDCIQTYQLLVLLFIVPYLCKYLFKFTGKVWLGAMISCLTVVTTNVANSMLHILAQNGNHARSW